MEVFCFGYLNSHAVHWQKHLNKWRPYIQYVAKEFAPGPKAQCGMHKLWSQWKLSWKTQYVILCRNTNATDVDGWPSTAQMTNCHLNVEILGSKAETIISLTSVKDPRAACTSDSWVSHHSTDHKEPQGCTCLTEHEIFHWLSFSDKFNIFNVTSSTQDESSTFKFTNRIRDSCRALWRSSSPHLGLQANPRLLSVVWESPWF